MDHNSTIPSPQQRCVFLLWENMSALSGVTVMSQRVATALATQKTDVRVIVIKPSSRDLLDSDSIYHAHSYFDFLRKMKEWAPLTLVVMCHPLFSRHLLGAAALRHFGVDVRILGMIHSDEAAYYDQIPLFERYVNCFAAVGPHLVEQTRRCMRRLEMKRVFHLPLGVEPDPLSHIDRSADRESPLRIIYGGRLVHKQKRILDYVKVFQCLDAAHVPYECRFVGDGSERELLESLLVRYPPKGTVEFTGRKSAEDMQEEWRRADVFINLSAYEGNCLAMLEAMNSGCVPVISDVSGPADILRDGDVGFRIPLGNARETARIIKELHLNRDLLNDHAKRAQTFIQAKYAIDLSATLHNKLLHTLEAGSLPANRNSFLRLLLCYVGDGFLALRRTLRRQGRRLTGKQAICDSVPHDSLLARSFGHS